MADPKISSFKIEHNHGNIVNGAENVNLAENIFVHHERSYSKSSVTEESIIIAGINILQSKGKREFASAGSYMRRLPWLKESSLKNYYVNLTIIEKRGSCRAIKGKQLKYEEILLSSNEHEEAPKTILILGGAGFGKSTLVTKIVHDWTTKKDIPVSAFKIVILCRLREVPPKEDLEEYLLKYCSDALKDELESEVPIKLILRSTRENVLVILDGYDELNFDQRASVKKILSKDSFFHSSTLIVTSRPDELEDNFHNCFERHISISALSEESRELLVDKVFEDDEEQAAGVKLFLKNHVRDFLSELSPLLLFAVCSIFEEKRMEKVVRGSDLIYEVTRVMFLRAYIREYGKSSVEEKSLIETLLRLGKLFLQRLANKHLIFLTDELMDVLQCQQEFVSKVGLFQPLLKMTEQYWEPIQKVFMDSLAIDSLNNTLRRFEEVDDAKTFICETLGDISQVKTILFHNKSVKVIAFCGAITEVVYVTFESRSIFDGIFETFDDLKSQFNDYVCDIKRRNLMVYSERESKVTFNETFGENSLQSSRKVSIKRWDSNASDPCKITPNLSTKFLCYGEIMFAEKNMKATSSCEKLKNLPLHVFRLDIISKDTAWAVLIFQKSLRFDLLKSKE